MGMSAGISKHQVCGHEDSLLMICGEQALTKPLGWLRGVLLKSTSLHQMLGTDIFADINKCQITCTCKQSKHD